jgi:hypothetical protein
MSLVPDSSSVVVVYPAAQTSGRASGGGSGSGNGGSVTMTEGISAFIAGETRSSTQSGPALKQTGSIAAGGRYTGHDRICWVLGALGGVWGFVVLVL